MTNLFSEHLYPLMGLGLMIGGIPALLGSIYLALQGYIDVKMLFVLFFVASLLLDVIWYGVGRVLRKHHPKWVRGLAEKARKAEQLYVHQNIFKMVFISRFVYGTNSAVSILSGVKRVSFSKFLLTCMFTLFIWFFVMLLIGYSIEASLPEFQSTLNNVIIGISVFWLTIISIFILLKKYIWAKLTGEKPEKFERTQQMMHGNLRKSNANS
ncbi:MAG: VTT domain-containing protein [Patescibacteria group bacterium]